jgi:dCTP deaminase
MIGKLAMAILKSDQLESRINHHEKASRIVVVPKSSINLDTGAAAIDLRLGRWFTSLRSGATPALDISVADAEPRQKEHAYTKRHFIPFSGEYYLQPKGFVLGVTLEWIKLPQDLAGYITSRSRIGRRGLIIATAAGVHPGFSGCLTLELSNVSDVPIILRPGLTIGQLFVHETLGAAEPTTSDFAGSRLPIIGPLIRDEFAEKLARRRQ